MYFQPTLLDNLKVQYRVIRALMLRQILLRWGRSNLGYLWLIIEPMVLILVIVGFISIFSGKGFEKSHMGIGVVPFLLIGFSQSMTWRFVSHKCGGAFSGSIPLLEHKFIRPLDIFVSTAIIELLGVSIAFLVIWILSMFVGFVDLPENLPLMIFGWFLTLWLAFSYGIFFGALSGAFVFVDFAMRGINAFFYFSSGVLFAVVWIPPEYRDLVLWVPMLHCTEMLRHAYFGEKLVTFENPLYLVSFNFLLTFLALLIARASWLEDIRE